MRWCWRCCVGSGVRSGVRQLRDFRREVQPDIPLLPHRFSQGTTAGFQPIEDEGQDSRVARGASRPRHGACSRQRWDPLKSYFRVGRGGNCRRAPWRCAGLTGRELGNCERVDVISPHSLTSCMIVRPLLCRTPMHFHPSSIGCSSGLPVPEDSLAASRRSILHSGRERAA